MATGRIPDDEHGTRRKGSEVDADV